MSRQRIVGLIPARYASTRLPRKPLEPIMGKPMIQWVYERTQMSKVLDAVYVATDDERIMDVVRSFDGMAVLTSSEHSSGTDRLAEAVQSIDADIIVNIQGDQPFIDPAMIDECVCPLMTDSSMSLATLIHPISTPEELADPGVVKTVTDLNGFALYFSRSLIPHPWKPVPHTVYEHIGLYCYTRTCLLELASLSPTPLEQVESLEQLRWLEHGYRILCVETRCTDNRFSGFSIDTREDIKHAEAMLRERGMK